MAIIIRETKILDGKSFDNIKVYKSDKLPITIEEEKAADNLDFYLSQLFENLNIEIKNNGLLKLRGNKGVIDLWYFVGEKLQFIDNENIVKPIDKKYIWKAIWYYAKEISPGEAKTRAGTARDHFLYCYKIAKYDKDFVISAGTWRDWMDFFDSPILSNTIFLKWFEPKILYFKENHYKNWLREFVKLVRNEFYNIDMSFLTPQEIETKCDKLFNLFIKKS